MVNMLSLVPGMTGGMGSHKNEMDIEVAFSLEIDPCVRKPIIYCVYCFLIEGH